MTSQKQFIERVQACEGLINKILFLYTDREEDRKDLRQEILSEAWRSYSGFREDAKFSTWLYRVGLNVAITSLHKRKRRPESEPFDSQSKSTRPKTGRKDELLHQILGLLKPVEKSIILLLVDGFSNPEISDMLGLSHTNTRVKIHRIRKKLEDHGIKDIT